MAIKGDNNESKEVERKEDIIETQNEGEKDKEDVIEDEVKGDQKEDDDIKLQLDRLFDAVNGITADIDSMKETVSSFVDFGGVVTEVNDNEVIESEDKPKFVPIEELDLRL